MIFISEIKNKYKEYYKTDVRFENPSDVRRFLSRIVNLRANDLMDSETSRDLGYLCNILLKSIDQSTIEERILELENHIENNKNKFKVV